MISVEFEDKPHTQLAKSPLWAHAINNNEMHCPLQSMKINVTIAASNIWFHILDIPDTYSFLFDQLDNVFLCISVTFFDSPANLASITTVYFFVWFWFFLFSLENNSNCPPSINY